MARFGFVLFSSALITVKRFSLLCLAISCNRFGSEGRDHADLVPDCISSAHM